MYASNLTKNFATMNLSEVDTSIVKATFEDDAPPKEKHVINLIDLTRYERDLSFSSSIFKRLTEKKWRIVLKTLILIHRLCRDGDEKCLVRLEARKVQLDTVRSFSDRISPAQTQLVRRYGAYLEQKLRVYGITSYSAERVTPTESKEWALKLSLEQAFAALPATQHQFVLLLSMDPLYAARETRYIHPLAVIIFTMLLRDALRMYSVCTVQMYVALENYEKMDRDQTVILLNCCKKSIEINTAFRQWCQRLSRCRIAKDCVPNFSPLPDHFFQLLENRIDMFDGKDSRHAQITTSKPTQQQQQQQQQKQAYAAAEVVATKKKTPRPPQVKPPATVRKTPEALQQSQAAAYTAPVQRQAGAFSRLKAERRAKGDNYTDEPGMILLPDPSLAANSQRLLAPPTETTASSTAVRGRNNRVNARTANTTTSHAPPQPIVSQESESEEEEEEEDIDLFELYKDDPFDVPVTAPANPQITNQQQQQLSYNAPMNTDIFSQLSTQPQQQQQMQQMQPARQSDPFNFDAIDAFLMTEETTHINTSWDPTPIAPGATTISKTSANTTGTGHRSRIDDDPFAALAAEAEKNVAAPSSSLVLHSSENKDTNRSQNASYLYPTPLNYGPPISTQYNTQLPDRLPVATQFESVAMDNRRNAIKAHAGAEFDPFAGLVKTSAPTGQSLNGMNMYYSAQPMYVMPQISYQQQQPQSMYPQAPQQMYNQQMYNQQMYNQQPQQSQNFNQF